ncbi:MAG TPA: hypothetical protein VEZ40_09240 [Pyrinomonadaceae bacterium]|nr:hypothetical protein [Pyrinomonadaceae bacterium]
MRKTSLLLVVLTFVFIAASTLLLRNGQAGQTPQDALPHAENIFALLSSSRDNHRPEQTSRATETHSALKQDLVSKTGEKIVEVIEASYQTTGNNIDRSSVRLMNLSNRNITAIGIIWTVKFTDMNQCLLRQIVDHRLHQDIVEAKGIRPFAPYEERVIPRLTNHSLDDGQKIESVAVEISFVEFEDSSGVGIEKSETYKELLSKRRGAELYKQWIESGYGDDPRNLAKVIRTLSSDELPINKELENGWAEIGASAYRQWMRNIHSSKGETALREQIHRQAQRRK